MERALGPPDLDEFARLQQLGMRPIAGAHMLEHAGFLVDCSSRSRTYHDVLASKDRRIVGIRVLENDMHSSGHDVRLMFSTRFITTGTQDFRTIIDRDGSDLHEGGDDPEHTPMHRELVHLEEMPMEEQLRAAGFVPHALGGDRVFYRLTTKNGEFIAGVRGGRLVNMFASADTPGQVHPLLRTGRIVKVAAVETSEWAPPRPALVFANGPYVVTTVEPYSAAHSVELTRDLTPREKVELVRTDPHLADEIGLGWYPQGRIPAGDPFLVALEGVGAPNVRSSDRGFSAEQ